MENEVLKMYEYAEQTIEISLVKEEEIPVMLELMNTIYQELPDKSWFSMDSEENLIRYMSTSGFALKAHTCENIYHIDVATFPMILFVCDELQEWGRKSWKIYEFKGKRS